MTKQDTKRAARKAARRSRLFEILSWSRPHGSEVENRFCREFLDKVPGMKRDGFGNRYIQVGKDTRVLWSCHVDTVAKAGQQNELVFDAKRGIVSLKHQKPGQSLGADDGVGVWIMLEMIAGGKPGLYIFHRGEESGCLGSRWIADNTPELLEGRDYAIAFDRAGTSDVITHQVNGMGCSDEFAWALAGLLNEASPGLTYCPNSNGIYTDTNEYFHLIPECTNLSVGYQSNHGPRETLDVYHAEALLSAALKMDTAQLPVVRRAGETDQYGWGWQPKRASKSTTKRESRDAKDYRYTVLDNPEVAVELLLEAGISLADFEYLCWAKAQELEADLNWDDYDDPYQDETVVVNMGEYRPLACQ